ncbi:thermonuclease family protein [Taklimakanibacter lacteus]|uniref:thermonuclease family protein n=1 Tax=Taklimakanibacter lacteus TaxID=2268456 RepID=UPI000E6673CE
MRAWMTGPYRNTAREKAPSLVPRIRRQHSPDARSSKSAALAGDDQWFAYGLAVVALLFLILIHAHGGPGAMVSGPASIVDGDTLRIGRQEIRIRGIEAPDAGQACRRPQGVWDCSRATIVAMAKLIAGRTVRCEGSERDGHGRLIGHCSTESVPDIGAWLVSAGLARAFIRQSSEYVDLERLPRSRNLGIWQSTTQK